MPTIDDFEDQSLSEYSGDTADFDFETTNPLFGSASLRRTGSTGFSDIISSSGLGNYPTQGDTFEVYVKTDDLANFNTWWIYFANQDANNNYRVQFVQDNGSLYIHEEHGGTLTQLASDTTSFSETTNTVRIEIDWASNGDVTALAEEVGNESNSATVSAAAADFTNTWTSGGFGVANQNNATGTVALLDAAEILGTAGIYGPTVPTVPAAAPDAGVVRPTGAIHGPTVPSARPTAVRAGTVKEQPTYSLILEDSAGNSRSVTADEMAGPDFARTHTGVGTWSTDVDYDLSFEDWIGADVQLRRGAGSEGELLFRGKLKTARSDERAGVTELSGQGIGIILETSGGTRATYRNVEAGAAIFDYLEQEAGADLVGDEPFTTEVHLPEGQTTVNDEVLQTLTTTEDFRDFFTVPETDPNTEETERPIDITDPLVIWNNQVERLPTAWFREGENNDGGTLQGTAASGTYSGGSAAVIATTADDPTYIINTSHDIPDGNVELGLRVDIESTNHEGFDVYLNGTQVMTFPQDALNVDLDWQRENVNIGGLKNGQHVIEIRGTSNVYGSSGNPKIDCLALVDDRYPVTWDNSVDANDALSGPEPFGGSIEIMGEVANAEWNIEEAVMTVAMNDSSGDQRIQMSLEGEDAWYPTDGSEDNTAVITTSFGAVPATALRGRIRLGGYGTQTSSPTDRINGQSCGDWDIIYDGNNKPIFDEVTVEGDHLSNLQRLHELADMRFVVKHDPDQFKVTSWRSGDLSFHSSGDWTILNRIREVSDDGYTNHVTVRGARDSQGTRRTSTAEIPGEIDTHGIEHYDDTDPGLTTQVDVDNAARSILSDRVTRREIRGEFEIVPVSLEPGRRFEVQWSDGTVSIVPLEEVAYMETAGDLAGRLQFRLLDDIAANIANLRYATDRAKD